MSFGISVEGELWSDSFSVFKIIETHILFAIYTYSLKFNCQSGNVNIFNFIKLYNYFKFWNRDFLSLIQTF